jgi:hypothetical protein
MTKGQRAMIMAKIYPEPAKLKRKGSGSGKFPELDDSQVAKARFILKMLPEGHRALVVVLELL